MTYQLQQLNQTDWLSAAKEFNDYGYMHYWAYGEQAAKRVNADSDQIAVLDENQKIVAMFNVRVKKIPFELGGIAYISGGAMIDKGQTDLGTTLTAVLTVIKQAYVTKRGLVLRIFLRPKTASMFADEATIYHQLGFIEQGKTNATILVDLSPDLALIRKNLHQKWRNILNKSEKQEITVVAGNELSLFTDFEGLFTDLLQRKGLDIDMDNHFFKAVQENSPEQEKFHIAIAYKDELPISGHVSSISGDTSVYILGATNDVGRKLGAAYLLQWHVIEESKKQGCQWYDLGGINPEENPPVYQFKKRMGGEETEVTPVFQIQSGLKGILTLGLEKLYKQLRSKIRV
ncbi:MAG: peptidoglycan bridge formation glycyltransferase FemA/FemB family protein [Methylococcales bacterium]|nr:peptidoglycan bridge formation glycyltransferase FemA/FemB family protein [Methylococcales bacterium]